jgi:ATP-binding cassette subfamily F protein uup
MLADYEGTLLLVSHDRDFLDRVVTSTIVMEGDGTAVEYPGGYSDYLRQRPARREVAARAGEVKKTPVAAAEKPKPAAKLSYKHQRALEMLPKEIAALEAEIALLTRKLAAADFYNRDAAGFEAATKRLHVCEAALAKAEDDWLQLEILREGMTS